AVIVRACLRMVANGGFHLKYTVIWRLVVVPGWTVFQRRKDNFYRNWTDYENEFGNLTGEFWLELSKFHCLTKEESNTLDLRVDLGDFEGNTAYANYSTFSASDGSTEYILTVEGYSGTAGDGLSSHHNGSRFST
uniref:Fibrinogen C-terminal domain-containing protein n=1 Tax=Amphimedon queenslandica TaxID=400682 RepID=A0A1X7SS03_AMPQE